MVASLRTAWARGVWRLLVAVDVVLVVVFAVAAAIEPYHILESSGVEIHNFQGLLPTVIVVTLRSTVLVAERRLLPVAHGRLVLAGRLASLMGFYYLAQWLYHDSHGRWYEVVLGGTLGYSFVGVAGIGLAALVYNLSQIWSARPTSPVASGGGPTGDAAANRMPGAPGPAPAVPAPAGAPGVAAPAAQRRQLTRQSLFALVGVFQGVTGLVMGVTDMARLGVAVLVGAVAVAAIALLVGRQPG
ncbi:MAG TPA: hypothetical protein VGP31_19175 [Planosporangium sp.]|nr:hypothetical protein [Planosporangium sp.]